MKPDKHEIKWREFIRLKKRSAEVQKQIRDRPLVKLESPIQDGWIIYYAVREDLRNRKDAAVIEQVINLGYRTHHTRSAQEVRAVRGGKTKVKQLNGKWKSVLPQKRTVKEEQYNQLSEAHKKYFILEADSYSYVKWNIKTYLVGHPMHWVRAKAKANIVTHVRRNASELEREYAYLQDKIDELSYAGYGNWRNYGKSFPKTKQRMETREAIGKFMNGEVEDILIEKIPLEYKY